MFAPFLGVVSVVAHRARLIEVDAFSLLFWFVFALALFALLLVFSALRSLWVRGKKGGRRASWALFFCVLVLSPYAWMGFERWSFPDQADTSTDVVIPPLFLDELRTIEGDARAIVAAALNDGYPELEGQRFRADMENVYTTLEEVARLRGLELQERRGRIGANDEIFLEYRWYSPIIRWPHEAVFRLTDEGDTTFVDIRSRSLQTDHDRGTNMRMIRLLQVELDYALIGVTG